MFRRIEIENLGPVRKAALDLAPVTVLLGANASGKSSLLHALEFLGQIINRNLTHAEYAGFPITAANWPAIIHRGQVGERVKLSMWGNDYPFAIDLPHYRAQIGIDEAWTKTKLATQGPEALPDVEILADQMVDPAAATHVISGGPGKFRIRSLEIGAARPHNTSAPFLVHGIVTTGRIRGLEDLNAFATRLGGGRYFKPSSSEMTAMTAHGRVTAGGSGFINKLAALQNRDSRLFARIEDRLRQEFPHIEQVNMPGEGNIRSLEFKTSRSSVATPADLEADGVLTTLFLLWAAFSSSEHTVLLLDDPESGLHPHRMARRVEFLRELAAGKVTGYPVHVVAATQSVEFVRYFGIDEVRIVEFDAENGTQVRKVDEDETIKRLIEKFGSTTADLWYSGALGGVPGTRS